MTPFVTAGGYSRLRSPHCPSPVVTLFWQAANARIAPEDQAMATMTTNARQVLLSMTYPAVPSAVGIARKSAEHVLGAAGFATLLVEDAGLVVCELVTNAVRAAAGTTVGLVVAVDGPWAVTVEVRDSSFAEPHRCSPGADDQGGRGLVIVAALADRYGVRPEPDGKTVFAVLRAPDEYSFG